VCRTFAFDLQPPEDPYKATAISTGTHGTNFCYGLSPRLKMENAFTQTTSEVLKYFSVSETQGLADSQVQASRDKHGRNGKFQFTLRRAQ
jgi:hypothetical protein